MLLSDVTGKLYAAGWSQDDVADLRSDLFNQYPEIEDAVGEHAMSTVPHDPEVPDDWAKSVLSQAQAVRLNPVFGAISDADRKVLLGKVVELLPDPDEAGNESMVKSIRNKIENIKKHILKSSELGITMSSDNVKIGAINNFSLPAGQNFRNGTCPGATETCESLCYAKRGMQVLFHEWKYYVNWAYVELWPKRFLEVWKTAKLSRVVRIHVGGDFYSVDYIRLWIGIARSRPDVRFYAYTRTWQDGRGKIQHDFVRALREFSELENARLVLSVDRETGIPGPDLVPAAIRAWLAVDDNDMPPQPLELLFRDKDGSGIVASVLADTPVCPVERSAEYVKKTGKITCQNCGWCWSTAHIAFDRRDDDLSKFTDFAKTDLEKRTALMFREFWEEDAVAANPMSKKAIGGLPGDFVEDDEEEEDMIEEGGNPEDCCGCDCDCVEDCEDCRGCTSEMCADAEDCDCACDCGCDCEDSCDCDCAEYCKICGACDSCECCCDCD